MAKRHGRPAFYAAAPGGWRDWWTLIHPPYTAWHLAYVVIGAVLAPHTDTVRLLATVLAFFFAVGVAAHALDEVHGHPLQTTIPDPALWLAACVGLLGAVALGVLGLSRVGPGLLAFILVGPLLVVGYNLELFGGRMHTDVTFALAWGTFPLLTGYYAAGRTTRLRRLGWRNSGLWHLLRAARFEHAGVHVASPGGEGRRDSRNGRWNDTQVNDRTLLEPLERALRALSWSMVALAVALVFAHIG